MTGHRTATTEVRQCKQRAAPAATWHLAPAPGACTWPGDRLAPQVSRGYSSFSKYCASNQEEILQTFSIQCSQSLCQSILCYVPPPVLFLAELYLLSWSNLESIGTFPGPLKNRKFVDEFGDNIDIFRRMNDHFYLKQKVSEE